MPTIKDIAKIAGVSHGTVSNVLNGKSNVSAKKIKLVEDAAQKLGYQLNLQAKVLKEGHAKTVSIILPNITSEQYSHLYDGLFNHLNSHGYESTLYLSHDIKELELQFIQKIATRRDSAIIVVSCLDSADPYYQTVSTPKNKIIFVYRKPILADQFISLDFEKAGQEIARAIMIKNYRQIGLLSNSMKKRHSALFKKGLLTAFNQAEYDMTLKHIESAPSESTYNLAFNFFGLDHTKFDAIVTSDIERAYYVKNANYYGCYEACPPIYTLTNNYLSYDGNFYPYHMNYGMLSQEIVNMINGKKNSIPEDNGFIDLPKEVFQNNHHVEVINFLIIASPSADAVKKLLPHFKKLTGIDVNLIIKPFDEIYHLLSRLESYPDIDVIRIDMAGLPWFAKSALKPLEELDIDLNELLSHYSSQITERFTYINNTIYAIPFDPSIQMLFYRKDIFHDPLIKRLYFEKYKQQLSVPTNFSQFDQVTAFFNRKLNDESPVQYGSCITLGNTEIISSEFLLRYYAKGGRLVGDHANIAIAEVLGLAVLNEFKDFIRITKNIDAKWWQDSVKEFEQGNLAMLIVYINLFSYMSHRDILPLVGYASVPGNVPLLGGGSLGMSKYSKKNKSVSIFMTWLFSKEISEQMALLGGSAARDNIFLNQKIINQYPWFDAAQENFLNGIRENHFNNDDYVNLRQVENIIGHHLLLWLNQKVGDEKTIENINNELKLKTSELIKA